MLCFVCFSLTITIAYYAQDPMRIRSCVGLVGGVMVEVLGSHAADYGLIPAPGSSLSHVPFLSLVRLKN